MVLEKIIKLSSVKKNAINALNGYLAFHSLFVNHLSSSLVLVVSTVPSVKYRRLSLSP